MLTTKLNVGVTQESKNTPDLIPVTLIYEIANGDEQSLADLYDLTKHITYGLALKTVRDPTVAEEIILEVYHQIWKQACNFNADRGTPLAWLVTITRNRAIDRLRQETRLKYRYQPLDKALFFTSNNENPEADNIFQEYGQYVRVALAQLPPGQREVLTMAYYFGMTQTEIAAQLSLPLGTIKSRIRYGLMQVKQALLQVNPLETSISSIFNIRLQH